ncbi:hypothetical protein EJ07DRAFT_172891 [Lizonia empirigonia]|nr:hypothetical protein EJ07DRAFT_172891 [Lizonia empirigonia]
MPPFPSPPSAPTKQPPIFAGLDNPFTFPPRKPRHTPRSSLRTPSPDSATDSGYGSIDDDRPLSPKSLPVRRNKRTPRHAAPAQLAQRFENHTEHHTEHYTEQRNSAQHPPRPPPLPTPQRVPDNAHTWTPNPKHTFTLICGDAARPTWCASRVYGAALRRRERCEGVTQLQREMAPVLRRLVGG